MKLTHVLYSVNNNPNYYLFIPLQIKLWERYDIKVIVIFAGNEIPQEILPYKDNIILWDRNLDLDSSYLGQNLRIYYPSLLNLPPDECVVISDIDMLMLDPFYLLIPPFRFTKEDFIYYRFIDGGMIYMCYNAAHPSLWGKIFKIKSPDDIERTLYENYDKNYSSYGTGWFIDQDIMYKQLINYPRLRILNKELNRLELSDFRKITDFNRLRDYTDFHVHRCHPCNLDVIEKFEEHIDLLPKINGLKVLILVIASDNLAVYGKLKELWRRHMHIDKKHIDVYFIQADPNLDEEVKIEGDTIWSRSEESFFIGIINKTLMTLNYLSPVIESDYDYVIRTNLSTFYSFPRLLKFLASAPRSGLYNGALVYYSNTMSFVSGTGIILSKDVALLLGSKAKEYFNVSCNDDIMISDILYKEGIRATPQERIDYIKPEDVQVDKTSTPESCFQFRLKLEGDDDDRIHHDVVLYTQLLKIHYGLDPTPKLFFLSFGAPARFYGALERITEQAKTFELFDEILSYTEKDLMEDREFWEKHKDLTNSNHRGYGYYIWKPYLVFKTLNEMNYGETLLYADAGCELNAHGKELFLKHLLRVKDKKIMGTSAGSNDFEYSKMDLVHELGMDKEIEVLKQPQMQATCLLIYKCNETIKLISDWWRVAQNHHMIDDSPSILQEREGFIDYRHDQSILSLLAKKYGLYNIELDNTCFGYAFEHALNYQRHAMDVPIWTCRNRTGVSIKEHFIN